MYVLNKDKKVSRKSQQPQKGNEPEPRKSHVEEPKSYVEAVLMRKGKVDKNT